MYIASTDPIVICRSALRGRRIAPTIANLDSMRCANTMKLLDRATGPVWHKLCIVILALFAMTDCTRTTRAAAAQPIDVEVVEVEQRNVPIYGQWIGTLDGLVNADVKAQVTGYLLKQEYKEGSFIKKG